MALQLKSGNGSEGYLGNGIYVDDAEVISVSDLSGKTTKFQQYASDLCVEVTVKLLKNDWEKTFNVAGNFARDVSTKEVTDWGGAFKVRDFFVNAGLKSELEELLSEMEQGSIPPSLMSSVIGKAIRILSYRNKKGKTSTWNQVSTPLRKQEAFKEYFLKEYNRSKQKPKGPWPSNYEPDDNTQEGDSFNYGANTENVNVSGEAESL
tara:strand:- start:341 stop:961 length:621 start_codon:yes stop_codon:yes gene_type:complete